MGSEFLSVDDDGEALVQDLLVIYFKGLISTARPNSFYIKTWLTSGVYQTGPSRQAICDSGLVYNKEIHKKKTGTLKALWRTGQRFLIFD